MKRPRLISPHFGGYLFGTAYQNADKTIPHENPIRLNAKGAVLLYGADIQEVRDINNTIVDLPLDDGYCYFVDKYGKPLANGKVYTYFYQSTVLKESFDNNGQLNTNPIILDNNGKAQINMDGNYRLRIYDKDGVCMGDDDWAEFGVPILIDVPLEPPYEPPLEPPYEPPLEPPIEPPVEIPSSYNTLSFFFASYNATKNIPSTFGKGYLSDDDVRGFLSKPFIFKKTLLEAIDEVILNQIGELQSSAHHSNNFSYGKEVIARAYFLATFVSVDNVTFFNYAYDTNKYGHKSNFRKLDYFVNFAGQRLEDELYVNFLPFWLSNLERYLPIEFRSLIPKPPTKEQIDTGFFSEAFDDYSAMQNNVHNFISTHHEVSVQTHFILELIPIPTDNPYDTRTISYVDAQHLSTEEFYLRTMLLHSKQVVGERPVDVFYIR